MHFLARELHGLDDGGSAVDLEQTPGEIVFLSFSHSELGLLSRVHEADAASRPSLRCASLARLQHPYSVDLYLNKVARHARLVVARLLGGKEYWSYGVEQLAALARTQGFAMAFVPGDHLDDPRLRDASTLPAPGCTRIWSFFQGGGAENMRAFLDFAGELIGKPAVLRDSAIVASCGFCDAARRVANADRGRALLVFYRSFFLSHDIAPILALSNALSRRGLAVEAVFVASLKESASQTFLRETIGGFRPDIIVNTTAFSARGAAGGVLDLADAPVLQAALATSSREAWTASKRGPDRDLAMHIVLPEVDGRIFTRAISFKAPAGALLASQLEELRHAPDESARRLRGRTCRQLGRVAPQGERREKPRPDFVGLSRAPRSGRLRHRARHASERCYDCRGVARRRYDVGAAELPTDLMRSLEKGHRLARLSMDDYRRLFAQLPDGFANAVRAAWGEPEQDSGCCEDGFRFSCIETGKLVIALQPDRGARAIDARPIMTPQRRHVTASSPFIFGCAIDAPSTR